MNEKEPSIAEILARHGVRDEALERDLIAREDALADLLRVAGHELGAMPEIVAKVLMDVGIGTPVDDDTEILINQQFIARLEWLKEKYRKQHGEEP